MRFLLLLVTAFISLTASSQTSFEYVLQTPEDQIPGSMLEDANGNIICTVSNLENALFIKLDRYGNLTDSLRLLNPDGTCELMELVRINDSSFAAFGNYMIGEDPHLWFVKFDFDLSILINNKIPVEYPLASLETHAILNSQNNLVVASAYKISGNNQDITLFEINQNGMLITTKTFQDPILNFPTEIIFDSLNSIYKVFILHPYQRVSPSLLNLDTDFNIINQAPYFTEFIDDQNSAKWLNDTSYILTGKRVYNGQFFLGILRVINDYVVDTACLGDINIVDWPGIHDNLDFIYPGSIYYVGFQCLFIPNNFIEAPSHIVVNKLNSDLKLSWQKYFGGDAYYMVKSIIATLDSGVVIASSRYDYLTQNMERDVYIFKVNKHGLITGVDDAHETAISEVLVYPNPGQDMMNIQLEDQHSKALIRIYDISGSLVVYKELTGGTTQIDMAGFPAGVYIYRITNKSGEFVETVKVMKNK